MAIRYSKRWYSIINIGRSSVFRAYMLIWQKKTSDRMNCQKIKNWLEPGFVGHHRWHLWVFLCSRPKNANMATSSYAKFGPSSASTLRSEGANLAETKALTRMFTQLEICTDQWMISVMFTRWIFSRFSDVLVFLGWAFPIVNTSLVYQAYHVAPPCLFCKNVFSDFLREAIA